MPIVQWVAMPELPGHELQSLPWDATTWLLSMRELRKLLEGAVCLPAAVQLLWVSELQRSRLG